MGKKGKQDLLKIGILMMLMVLCGGVFGCLPKSSNVIISHVSTAENIATLSKRDSGAMSKGSTLVSVRSNRVPDNDTHGLVVFQVVGDRPIEIKWLSAHNLAISCASCTSQDVSFEVVKSDDLIISYSNNLAIR